MTIEDLLRQIAARGRQRDAEYVIQLFADFVPKVLTINGRNVNGRVAGLGNVSITYSELFVILRDHLIIVRSQDAEDMEAARIEGILREAIK